MIESIEFVSSENILKYSNCQVIKTFQNVVFSSPNLQLNGDIHLQSIIGTVLFNCFSTNSANGITVNITGNSHFTSISENNIPNLLLSTGTNHKIDGLINGDVTYTDNPSLKIYGFGTIDKLIYDKPNNIILFPDIQDHSEGDSNKLTLNIENTADTIVLDVKSEIDNNTSYSSLVITNSNVMLELIFFVACNNIVNGMSSMLMISSESSGAFAPVDPEGLTAYVTDDEISCPSQTFTVQFDDGKNFYLIPNPVLDETATPTGTKTPSNTPTGTGTGTSSNTATETGSRTASNTATGTGSQTPSNTPTGTGSQTPSKTNTLSNTPTGTPTGTMTGTSTSSITSSPTPTGTAPETLTPTSSSTNSISMTPTGTLTLTSTPTNSPTMTGLASPSPSNNTTPSETPSKSFSNTAAASDSMPSTISATLTPTPTPTSTESQSITGPQTQTPSPTASNTQTSTSSQTPSSTSSNTQTPSSTSSNTPTPSSTSSFFPSNSQTFTSTPSNTKILIEASVTNTPSSSITISNSNTPSSTISISTTSSISNSVSTSLSNSIQISSSNTPSSSNLKLDTNIQPPLPSQPPINNINTITSSKSRSAIFIINDIVSSSQTPSRIQSIINFQECDFNSGVCGGLVESDLIAPSGSIITINNPDIDLINQSDTSDIVSFIVDFQLSDGSTDLGGDVEVCFESNHNSNDNLCLGYLDESLNPPEWICQDHCLQKNSDGLICGNTDHFTNFALLLSGSGNNGNCGDDEDYWITGSGLGDFYLVLSCALFCLIVALIFICVVLNSKNLQLCLMGREGMRISRGRPTFTSKIIPVVPPPPNQNS